MQNTNSFVLGIGEISIDRYASIRTLFPNVEIRVLEEIRIQKGVYEVQEIKN